MGERKPIPRRRKYIDCIRGDGNCTVCPLVKDRTDCKGRKISGLEWWRLARDVGQKELSAITGIPLRTIQDIELGASNTGNMKLRYAVKAAKALRIRPEQLLD